MEEVDNDYFPSQVDPPPPSNNNNNNATDNKGRGGAKGPSSSSSLLNATNNTSTNISSSNSSGANSTRHHNTSTLNETTDSLPRVSSSAESPSPLPERSDTVVGSGAETLSPSPSSLPPSSGSSAEVPSSSRSVGHADSPAPSLSASSPPPPPPVTTERSSSPSTLVDMKEEELTKVPNTITSIGVDEGCASHTEPAAGGRCLVDGSTGGDRAATILLDSLPKDEVNVDTRNSEVPTLGADGISSFLSTSTPTRDDPPLSFWDLVLQISQSQHAAAFTLSSKVIQSFAALGGTLQQAALALIPESLDPTEWGERLEWSPLALLFSSESTPASSQVPSWLSSEFLWNVVETHTAECVMVAVCVVLFALKCLISFRYRKYRSILSDIALQQQQRRQQDAPSSSSGGLSDAMRGGGVQKAIRTGLKEKRSLSLNQL